MNFTFQAGSKKTLVTWFMLPCFVLAPPHFPTLRVPGLVIKTSLALENPARRKPLRVWNSKTSFRFHKTSLTQGLRKSANLQ